MEFEHEKASLKLLAWCEECKFETSNMRNQLLGKSNNWKSILKYDDDDVAKKRVPCNRVAVYDVVRGGGGVTGYAVSLCVCGLE